MLHGPRGGAALLQQGGAVLVQVSKRQRHHARATGVLQRPSVRVSEARLGPIHRRRRADSSRLHRRQVGVPHAEDVPPRRPLIGRVHGVHASVDGVRSRRLPADVHDAATDHRGVHDGGGVFPRRDVAARGGGPGGGPDGPRGVRGGTPRPGV